MLGPRLLLLLSCAGPLLVTGLHTTSFTSPGSRDPTDSLQTAPGKGQCSTWGTSHFSTFDGRAYEFSGTCNYVLAATCREASPTFSVQLRRGVRGSVSRIIVELGATAVTVSKGSISVKDVGVVSLPYTRNGLQITPHGHSVQLVAKQLELELVVTWGPDSHLMVLVERKYMGQMCGLCGNFDGKADNEFLSEDGKLLEPHKYAILQKLDDPNEICSHEAIPRVFIPQNAHARICAQLLDLVSPECNVPKEPLLLSCQADMAECDWPGQRNCSCATLSEYSRRCRMAGQPVSRWRSPGFCSLGQCPANQIYQECGTPCIGTCSNPQHSCSSTCTSGCFCPDGMVLNDLTTNHTCVPISQCPCMLGGALYQPGQATRAACRTCQCSMGRWACTEKPCPGHCALEGGSFVTTFDARPYRFHGTCTYILLQSPWLPDEGTLMAVYDKSGYSHSETSLVAVVYLSRKDKIMISEDETITNHGDTKWLPYKTHNITIFRQTSTHLQMATSFGLELVIQMQPVFQVYITVSPQFRGQTRGLCGNFNGDTTDDFTTSAGLGEGTASLFVDSWRAGNCPTALERETDPCSMSQLNKVCAETHCSMLLRKGSVFEKCHTAVNPQPFYKRCVYQACNYEETFPHICAALGAYAQACSSRGVLLWGWRSSVDNCTVPCSGNRTFSYNSTACDRTCLSLSDRTAECHSSSVPVDGCNCPEGTYLNHKAECVRKAQCPCLLDGSKFVLADQSTIINGAICYCTNGRLSCPRQQEMFLASCMAPKTFQSCSQSSEDKFGAACAPTCQMLATGSTCVPTKCEPGCVCAKGLYENPQGQCVPPEECPCEYAGTSYPGGAELHTDCKTCTCSQGKWTCQQNAHCSATCVLYGEGHMITFDGQRFVFDGNCEYILTTDGCGANSSQPTLKILTENVICGNSGVTCSRAIKISVGGLSITMADRNFTVSGREPAVHFQVKPSNLNLILDLGMPGRFNLTLIWNKHMSVSIKMYRISQDPLCGLCGNYNGNMKDDFETRTQYVAPSELEFVNSWKENPLCGDASYVVDPCSINTFRRSWAERKCSIINSQSFAACHSKVYHLPYYEACVRDTCGCDTGGDCECLCDAVAAYAKACLDKGVCVDWRTPSFCPIYCDFYNTHKHVGNEYQYTPTANCTWHYQPCLCPGRLESFPDTNVEGCYNCSQDEYFNHQEGICVPCTLLPTTPPTTSGPQPTEVLPTTPGVSSGPPALPTGPVQTASPATAPSTPPSSPSSPEGGTTVTTPRKSTVSSGATTAQEQGPSTGTGYTRPPPSDQIILTTQQHGTESTTPHTWSTLTSHNSQPSSALAASTQAPQGTSPHPTTTPQTPSGPQTPLPSLFPSSTSASTPSSHEATITTSAHLGPSASTAQTTAVLPITTVKTTGPTLTAQTQASGTTATTQSHSSLTPKTTSAHLLSQPSTLHHPTSTESPTTRATGRPPANTGSASPSTHSPSTTSVSTTAHSTGPPTATPLQTTSTLYTPSTPQTSLTSLLPTSSSSSSFSSSGPPSSHRTIPPSVSPAVSGISSSGSTDTLLPASPVSGTGPAPTTPPLTPSTAAPSAPHSSLSTDRTSTPTRGPLSSPGSPALSPPPSSLTTLHPHPSLATSPPPASFPPSSTVWPRTSLSLPTPTVPTTLLASSTAPPASSPPPTSQYAPTPSSVPPSPSVTRPTALPPSSSPTAASTALNTPLLPLASSPSPPQLHASPTTHAPPASTPDLLTSASALSTWRTTLHIPTSSASASQSTTAQVTSLTTHTPSAGPLPSTLATITYPGATVTNLTTRPPGATQLPTSMFPAGSSPPTGSPSASTPKPPAPTSPWGSSAMTSPPRPSGPCGLLEQERQITYQGCEVNVTLTHCEGLCSSSVSFNTDTLQVDTHCSCCYPLGTHEKQLLLPCPDPSAPGRQLTLTLQVFSGCACRPWNCRD
ncbi:PREDICTED: mucin-6 [Dipodomys ordii]|uniref:Mucin-6 n=1 Tax=Dipodomys ordii TaxID=10020 RepID=A0A1S3GLC4_DIPOR|nr:PREDICTED: mucin-6 [Dipodomys ordii]